MQDLLEENILQKKKKKNPENLKKIVLPKLNNSRNQKTKNLNKTSKNFDEPQQDKKEKSKSFFNNNSTSYMFYNWKNSGVKRKKQKSHNVLINLKSYNKRKIKNDINIIGNRSLDELINRASLEKKKCIQNFSSYKLKKNTKKLLDLSLKLSIEEKEYNDYLNIKSFRQIKNDLGRKKIKKEIKKLRSFDKDKIKNFQKKNINLKIEKNHSDLINFYDIYYKMENKYLIQKKEKKF